MDEVVTPAPQVSTPTVSVPTASVPQPKKIDDDRIWSYPQMKSKSKYDKQPKLNHKLPYRLEKAITRYYDFQNWFETIWMVLILNNRWTMTEVYVPEHMISELGGSNLSFSEIPNENTIVWKIVN